MAESDGGMTESDNKEMEILGRPFSIFSCPPSPFFLEDWLDQTSNELLQISLLCERSIEQLDDSLQRLQDIKEDYRDRGFARLSVQESIDRTKAKRPFTSSELSSLREKHRMVMDMINIVTESLEEKSKTNQRVGNREHYLFSK